MPSLASRRRSRSEFEDHDALSVTAAHDSTKRRKSGETDGFPDAHIASASGRHGKKGRATVNGLAAREDSAAPADPEDFQPGAIRRVTVSNFVTYEHAEFIPGPNLNMVIGPNGTGKSSLVCAICLGLGYGPKHLGRATSLGEFVKHGKDTATIEIELEKRPSDRQNPIIRLRITREDNHRSWEINNTSAPYRDVQALTSSMRIQIDNLCQFLPQDKVAEFAGLTPVQLLRETLRAAAAENMIQLQDRLQEDHRELKEVKKDTESANERLHSLETRQQGLQADVERIRQREAIQQKVADLEKGRIVAHYNEARNTYNEAKHERKAAEKLFKQLENASRPALAAVNDKKAYHARIQPVVKQREALLKKAETQVDQALRAVSAQDDKVKEMEHRKGAETKSREVKREEFAKIKTRISQLEEKLKDKPPQFDSKEYSAKISDKQDILNENEKTKSHLGGKIFDLEGEIKLKKEDRDALDRRRKDFQAAPQLIARLDRLEDDKKDEKKMDVARGFKWLRANAAKPDTDPSKIKFEREVYGPPVLLCSLKNLGFSDVVQALMRMDDFFSFTVQSRRDHQTLSDIFYKESKISVPIRACSQPLSSFVRPASLEEIQPLESFAIDHITGPEPVLAMLCSSVKLHLSGVSRTSLTTKQFQAIGDAGKLSGWAAGDTSCRVMRRKDYEEPDANGNVRERKATYQTYKVSEGKFWTDKPIDENAKKEVLTKLSAVIAELSSSEARIASMKARKETIDEGQEPLRREVDDLIKEKNQLQRAQAQHAGLGTTIEDEKKSLKRKRSELDDARIRLIEIELEHDQIALEKAHLALKHQYNTAKAREAHQALLEARIRLLEAESDITGLEARNTEVNNRLQQEQENLDLLRAKMEQAKAEAGRARLGVGEMVAQDDESILEHLNQIIEGKTVEDIDMEINTEKANLELIHGVDPAIIRQFQKRQDEIATLTTRKDELTHKLDTLRDEIAQKMEQWEPQVDMVVSKINEAFGYNFEQISCAGEVGIHKDEDFEQWAIEIKVKFRQNETLQQLNQHRQSGGERAVSTIFYLMALQSMAQAPFRVVDEINQGMDPRNERMMHERMVEIACREHTSQYFLITPKLLTGLRYDPRMRVLCIASGEHVPKDGHKLDFAQLVATQRRLVAAA